MFDATLENATSGRLLVVEKLLCSLKRQSLLSFEGQKTVIPPSMTFIFECDTIQNLSPSSVSDLALIYVDDRCLDIDREFNNWIATLNTYSSFFGKNSMSSHINQLYKKKLIKPVLEFTTQGATENKLVFYLSSKYLLMHFMSFFEIFLNETRKIKVAFAQLSEEEIEEGSKQPFVPDQRNASRTSFLKNREVKNFQDESQQASTIIPPEKKVTVVTATSDDILKIKYCFADNAPSSPIDKLSFIIEKDKIILDSVCIISLVWTLGIAWNVRYRSEFAEFMTKTINQYYSGSSFIDKLSSSPTCILSKMPIQAPGKAKKTIFDFCFDINLQRWVAWSDLKLKEHPFITPNFHNVELPVEELLKLNPSLAQ